MLQCPTPQSYASVKKWKKKKEKKKMKRKKWSIFFLHLYVDHLTMQLDGHQAKSTGFQNPYGARHTYIYIFLISIYDSECIPHNWAT